MAPISEAIRLYNRRSGRIEIEKVYGQKWMDIFYGRAWGRKVVAALLCRPLLSKTYGCLQQHRVSRHTIAAFIDQYDIDLGEVEVPPGGFGSFNDFFIRRLKPDARPIDPRVSRLISPADSRLQVFGIEADMRLTIKGASMTLPQLLGVPRLDSTFMGGMCLVFRLAPPDYHRFGYVDEGLQGRVHTVPGPLNSVSPLALRHKPDIHGTNYRQWCFIEGMRLGTMIQVEVGAMMVGSIVQHRPDGGSCRRGGEKGYFQFGGSTVILVLQPGRATMDPDILHYSAMGLETRVLYGEGVGTINRMDGKPG
jgi:phosphatidylserine decarboxylase